MKGMKKVTIVLQSPFLDRIPSLKTMIVYLAQSGYKIKIISSRCKELLQRLATI